MSAAIIVSSSSRDRHPAEESLTHMIKHNSRLLKKWCSAARRADLHLLRALLAECSAVEPASRAALLSTRVSTGQPNGWNTALHHAAMKGRVECVLWLIAEGLDPLLPNGRGLDAHKLALSYGHGEAAEVLREIKNGRATQEHELPPEEVSAADLGWATSDDDDSMISAPEASAWSPPREREPASLLPMPASSSDCSQHRAFMPPGSGNRDTVGSPWLKLRRDATASPVRAATRVAQTQPWQF